MVLDDELLMAGFLVIMAMLSYITEAQHIGGVV